MYKGGGSEQVTYTIWYTHSPEQSLLYIQYYIDCAADMMQYHTTFQKEESNQKNVQESEKSNISQVSLDNDIRYCIKHEANVSSVSGASEVCVNLFLVSLLVQSLKSLPDVVLGIIIGIGT